MIQLRGAFTALITPMTESGAVDYEGFRRLVEFQIAEGVGGLVPLGTTGETPTLDDDEEEKLIKIAVDQTNGRVPLIIGTGSNSTRHMVGYTKRAKDLGADAALVVTPYYNKPNDSGLLRHFEAAAETGLPVIVYNIAGRTGRNIPPALLETISQMPGVIGVKEASGDIAQIETVIREIAVPRQAEGRPFAVLSGDDSLTLPLLALGGDGVVSVISNLVPRKVAALTTAGLAGDFAECRRLHRELSGFMKAAFIETNPVPIKTAMTWAGLPGGPVRLPLGPLSKRNCETLKAALADLGIRAEN
ncbi:MAG: 4-hydroxy-tetrahydrodipicolinate synthase [Spirochaetaceae bacterium]|jgi:4-hydroxy-tetrahydrodipicolinate synthase|nr:4-hydroxy-tetrahydrodipicolinate synthase [Spirochaetaceae bacterium]